MQKYTKQPVKQKGAALITSLVILLILTVLGITAMGTTSMEELMTGNLRDQVISFQAAESGLTDGEREVNTWLVGASPVATTNGSNGVFLLDSLLIPNTIYADYAEGAFDDAVIWGNATIYGAKTGSLNLAAVATQPVYILEYMQTVTQTQDLNDRIHPTGKSIAYYRITTKGRGLSNNAVSLLQSTMAHRN